MEIINPVADTVATATYMGADVDWYIKADDIILKGKKESVSNSDAHPKYEEKWIFVVEIVIT